MLHSYRYERLKKLINEKVPEEYHSSAIFIAAAAAFLASSVVLVPGELLKVRRFIVEAVCQIENKL